MTAQEANPPGGPFPRRQQHHGLERSSLREPDRLQLLRPHGAHRGASLLRLLLPGRGAAPARAGRARSTTWTWWAARTPSRSWPPWPPSPIGWASPAPSTPPSTSPTKSPGSSPPSTISPPGGPAWNVVTSWDAFTGENFRRGGFLPQRPALPPGQAVHADDLGAVRLVERRRDRGGQGVRRLSSQTPKPGPSITATTSSRSQATSMSLAARRAGP